MPRPNPAAPRAAHRPEAMPRPSSSADENYSALKTYLSVADLGLPRPSQPATCCPVRSYSATSASAGMCQWFDRARIIGSVRARLRFSTSEARGCDPSKSARSLCRNPWASMRCSIIATGSGASTFHRRPSYASTRVTNISSLSASGELGSAPIR